MKICNNCNQSNLQDDANYCPKCGKAIYANSQIRLIDYDKAWRTIIFNRYFKSIESNNNCSIDEIIDLAGKVYHDKETLDYILGYRTTEYFDEPSVWGITEEIIKQYKYLSFMKNENISSLSEKIGSAISNWNAKRRTL